jgi:hypothetical protein
MNGRALTVLGVPEAIDPGKQGVLGWGRLAVFPSEHRVQPFADWKAWTQSLQPGSLGTLKGRQWTAFLGMPGEGGWLCLPPALISFSSPTDRGRPLGVWTSLGVLSSPPPNWRHPAMRVAGDRVTARGIPWRVFKRLLC